MLSRYGHIGVLKDALRYCAAGKQEVFVSELSKLYPVHNSNTRLLGYFELVRSMRFLLHHDGSWGYAGTMGYIPDS